MYFRGSMASILKSLRGLADPTRVRILQLLEREELSVVELQEILSMGQSRISSHLSQLKQCGLVNDRRSGKRVIYGLAEEAASRIDLRNLIQAAASELPECESDQDALGLVLRNRQDRMRAYFDELAGKFGRTYVPGRSWKSLAETLLKLLPPMVIADLGAGEGTLSLLMAQRALRVIAVDNARNMVDYGTALAVQNGVENLEYRLGELEDPPIDAESVDLAIFSQALHHARKPERAINAAHRILKVGGRVVILDLLKHSVEEARELYQDLWLGFSELELRNTLQAAGFERIETSVVDREPENPHFQILLAIATKP